MLNQKLSKLTLRHKIIAVVHVRIIHTHTPHAIVPTKQPQSTHSATHKGHTAMLMKAFIKYEGLGVEQKSGLGVEPWDTYTATTAKAHTHCPVLLVS